jgi:integrase
LRHTHATNLFRCGRDILYIRDQLGHADPETTLKIYTHLVKNHQISKTNKVISIDKYFEKISTQKAN